MFDVAMVIITGLSYFFISMSGSSQILSWFLVDSYQNISRQVDFSEKSESLVLLKVCELSAKSFPGIHKF